MGKSIFKKIFLSIGSGIAFIGSAITGLFIYNRFKRSKQSTTSKYVERELAEDARLIEEAKDDIRRIESTNEQSVSSIRKSEEGIRKSSTINEQLTGLAQENNAIIYELQRRSRESDKSTKDN